MSRQSTELQIIEILDEKVKKDVLLFSRKEIKCISHLTKRKNPCSNSECSKEEHEVSFHRLHDHSIGAVITKIGKNTK